MNNKGQTAAEFVILVSFMLVIFFVFFAIIQHRITDATDAQDYLYLKEANNVVLTEVSLAQQVHADYKRSFTLTSLGDKSYTIAFTDPYELTATFGSKEYVNFLSSPVKGQLDSSMHNIIFKLDGTMFLPNATYFTNASYAGVFMNVNPEQCYLATRTQTCAGLSYHTDCKNFFSLCNSTCNNTIKEFPEDCDLGPSNTNAPCVAPPGGNCSICNTTCWNITYYG